MSKPRVRSDDIRSSSSTFTDLRLPELVQRGLEAAGFLRPSPVQLATVPLGRFGIDLIVQAKSGTGKTATFGTIIADRVNTGHLQPQALVLCPTREIAHQIATVLTALGSHLAPRPMQCCVFVGGLNYQKDVARLTEGSHVLVATPGRMRSLLEAGDVDTEMIRMLVFDEADAMMSEFFQTDVATIYNLLPERKQVMAYSATYTPKLMEKLHGLMRKPQHINLCQETVSLEAIKQYYKVVPSSKSSWEVHEAKQAVLHTLLQATTFHQVVVFCNQRWHAQNLADALSAQGFPAQFTCGSHPQKQRMAVMNAMRNFQLRVLVSTDLTARGVDLEHVNVVVSLSLPAEGATLMHRAGRTGRFGTLGLALTLLTAEELPTLQAMVRDAGGRPVEPLPEELPVDFDFGGYEVESEEQQAALTALKLVQAAPSPPSPPAAHTDSVALATVLVPQPREPQGARAAKAAHTAQPVRPAHAGGSSAGPTGKGDGTRLGEGTRRSGREVVTDPNDGPSREAGGAAASAPPVGLGERGEEGRTGNGGCGGGDNDDVQAAAVQEAAEWEQWQLWASYWWWWYWEQHHVGPGGYVARCVR